MVTGPTGGDDVEMVGHEQLVRRLARPGTVPLADGLAVTVVAIRPLGNDRWEVRYAVPDLPDGVAQLPPPYSDELDEAAREYAEEVHGSATEHVRRYRPLPPPDRDAIRRELPDREALWAMLGQRRDGEAGNEVVVTPEAWQGYVVEYEVAAREDFGVDAARPGDGPFLACEAVDELLATLDEGEHFVVFDGRRFHRSTRRELPPVRSGAMQRRTQEILRRTGGRGEWRAYPPGQDGRGRTRD